MEKERQKIGVLVIGDLLLIRAALGRLLAALGFDVIAEAETADEAIRLAGEMCPDIALVDLDSDLDAAWLVETLTSMAPRPRVIGLSDRRSAAGHSRLIEAGASGLILKNDPPDTFEKAIQKVHAGEVWLDRSSTAEVLARMSRRRREEDAEGAKIDALTQREHQIIMLVGEGLKNAAIAQRLFISEATVRNHLTSIFEKLDLSDRFELAVYAFRHGLVSAPQHGSSRR